MTSPSHLRPGGFARSGGPMPHPTDTTSETELLAWLRDCSHQPRSAARTADVDELLDVWLEWGGQS